MEMSIVKYYNIIEKQYFRRIGMNTIELKQISNAIEKFDISEEVYGCVPYGNGHINDTCLVMARGKDGGTVKYILQAINHNVFKEPLKVMENIEKVTAFLDGKVKERRGVLRLIDTKLGRNCYVDEYVNIWRMYEFVENSICLDRPETLEDFRQCAIAFGEFQRYLADFPADSLYETIPDFHNTPKRYRDFLDAVEADICGRAAGVREEIEFIKARKDFYPVLFDSYKAGKLPLKVTHNDTKPNNVMLDKDTRKALCVIDLDTVMPGFSVTDFGDSIRFGASTADEDEKDVSKVSVDLKLFDIYTEGFLTGCGGMLTDDEIRLLPEGAKMMTIECGMRFLTDYLSGDTYFKTAYPEHNLVRCRTQLKLVADMEEKWDEMKRITAKYLKGEEA